MNIWFYRQICSHLLCKCRYVLKKPKQTPKNPEAIVSQFINDLSPYGLPTLYTLGKGSFVMAVAMILCPYVAFWLLYWFFRKYYTINCLLLFKSWLSYNSQFFLSCNFKRNLLFNNCNFINILQLRVFFLPEIFDLDNLLPTATLWKQIYQLLEKRKKGKKKKKIMPKYF